MGGRQYLGSALWTLLCQLWLQNISLGFFAQCGKWQHVSFPHKFWFLRYRIAVYNNASSDCLCCLTAEREGKKERKSK